MRHLLVGIAVLVAIACIASALYFGATQKPIQTSTQKKSLPTVVTAHGAVGWTNAKQFASDPFSSADGKRVLGHSGSQVKVWAAETGSLLYTLNRTVDEAVFSADGRLVVTYDDELAREMHYWDIETGKEYLPAADEHIPLWFGTKHFDEQRRAR